MFDTLTVCLDMHGCNNRCKHCFLPHQANPSRSLRDLDLIAKAFKPYAKRFCLYGWTRGIDKEDDYKHRYEKEQKHSDPSLHKHFPLVDTKRAANDDAYCMWLKSIGVTHAQLTFFGMGTLTDWMSGRKGVFQEQLRASKRLFAHGIALRWQYFLNQYTLKDVEAFVDLMEKEGYLALSQPFSAFAHQGSCDGNNVQFYDAWLRKQDLKSLPKTLLAMTKEHFKETSLEAIFGIQETDLIEEYKYDESPHDPLKDASPIIYIDGSMRAYLHFTAYSEATYLGHVIHDGAKTILSRLKTRDVKLLQLADTMKKADLVAQLGQKSDKLFCADDWFDYLLFKATYQQR